MNDKPSVKLAKAPDAYTGEQIEFKPARHGITVQVPGVLACYQTGVGTNLCATYVVENGKKNATYWFDQTEVEALGLA